MPGHGRNPVEQPSADPRIVGEPPWPAGRLIEIRNGPAAPAAHLVAKHAQPADVAAPHGTRCNHASTRLVIVRRRRDFDRVAITVQLDDERCVIEVALLPTLAGGFDDSRLLSRVERAALPDPESRPVEVDFSPAHRPMDAQVARHPGLLLYAAACC
jgi:hypothetical protein